MRAAGRARWLAGAVLGSIAAVAGAGRAEIGESIAHLAQVWRAEQAVVVVDSTHFVNEDETASFVVPDLPPGDCTTVALLGPRGLGFHVQVVGDVDADHDVRMASQAGAVAIERCETSPPHVLQVTSDSGRGAVELVVARSRRPLAPVRIVLPERAGGDWLPGPEPGPAPVLASQDRRADLADARAKRDGASVAPRIQLATGSDGTGGGLASLDEGCHTLRLFPLDPRGPHTSGRGRVDLDAELRERAGDRVLARDRSDAPDAELSVCVGEPTQADVVFAGSPPRSPVLVTHYQWALPAHLPTLWGSEVRGRMARILRARHVVALPREPFLLTQGGSGSTPVSVPVEPGACYLAIVSAAQGTARSLGLRVQVGAREAFDERGIEATGAAAAFCARAAEHATAIVEAHGAPLLGWALAVYRVEDGAWESPP